MAIDTASERASSAQMVLGCLLSPPFPGGGFDQADRQHAAWTYRGILAGALVEGVVMIVFRPFLRPRRR